MRAVTSAEVVTYGTAGDVTATDVVLDEALQGRYSLRSPWGDVDVALAVRGSHHIDNSLGAAAAALVFGVDVDAVAAGLDTASRCPWRRELKGASTGVPARR